LNAADRYMKESICHRSGGGVVHTNRHRSRTAGGCSRSRRDMVLLAGWKDRAIAGIDLRSVAGTYSATIVSLSISDSLPPLFFTCTGPEV